MFDSTSPDRLSKVLPKVLPKALAKPLAKLCLSALATLAVAASVLLAVALPVALPAPNQVEASHDSAAWPANATRLVFSQGTVAMGEVATFLFDTNITATFTPVAGTCQDGTPDANPLPDNDPAYTVKTEADIEEAHSLKNASVFLDWRCDQQISITAGPCSTRMIKTVLQNVNTAITWTEAPTDTTGLTPGQTSAGSTVSFGPANTVTFTLGWNDDRNFAFETKPSDPFAAGFHAVNQIGYEFTGAQCSAKPTIALHADSQGANATTTANTTPKFTVTGVAASSKLTVSATQGNVKLSKPEITVPASVPSGGVEVDFSSGSGMDCTKVTTPVGGGTPTTQTGQSCVLAAGADAWDIVATHTDGTKTAVDSDTLELTVVAGSSKPTLALHSESITGATPTATAGSTNDDTPKFTVGNVVAGASVTLTYEKTGTAAVTTSAATVPANSTSVDVTLPALAANAGDWTVKATHTDGSKAAVDSDDFTLTVDTVAPTVTITADETSLTVGTNPTATVTFVISEPDTGFMSNHAINTNTAGATLTSLTPHGTEANTWEATLTIASTVTALTTATITVVSDAFNDAAGNGNTVATFGMPLHPQPASAKPTITLKDATSDTGSSATDGETKNTNPTFTVGNLVVGSSLEVKAVQGAVTISKRIASVGAASVDVPFNLSTCNKGGSASQPCALSPDGDWMVTAEHTEASKAKTVSDTLTVDVDTDAPAIASISSASTSINAAATITFTFDEPVTNFTSDAVTVTPGNTANMTNYSWGSVTGSGTTWMVPFTATAVDAYTLSVPLSTTVKDIAGNTLAAPASTVSGSVNVTAAPPSPAPTGLALKDADSDTGSSATDRITSNTNPSFTVTLPDTPEGRMSSTVKVTATRGGDTVSRSMTGVTATSVNIDFTDDNCTKNGTAGQSCMLAHGATAWSVTASNERDGNFSETSLATPIMVTVDTAAPTVSIAFAPTETAKPRAKQRVLTITAADTVTAAGDLSIVFVKQDAACPQAPMALTGAGSYSEQTYSSDGDSDAYICVEVTDEAGNKVRASDQIPTIDNVPPPVTARLVSATATREQKFQASTTETGKGTLTWHSASSFIASSATCATAPPGNSDPNPADSYIPGQDAAKTSISEAEDGMKMCFWATDEAGNVGSNFVLVDHVDRTGPTVAVRLATSPLRINNTVTVLFSTGEPVLDFDDANDVTVTNSTTSPPTNASLTTVEVYDPDNDPTTDPHTWSATLTAGTVTGEVVIAVAAGALTDTPGNLNGDSSGNDGTNGRLVVNIMDLVQSDPPTRLGISEDDTNDTGADDDDGITYDNTPGFEVDGSLVEGTVIRVIASKTGSSDTVTESKTASAEEANNNHVTLHFSSLTGCETSSDSGATTQTGQSCRLVDGTWTFSATLEAPNERESAAYPALLADRPKLIIDNEDPMITITPSPAAGTPTMTKSYSAADGDDPANPEGVTTWKSRVQPSTEPNCPSRPPGSADANPADDYTEGASLSFDREADNGKVLCFWATDAAGNRVSKKVTIADIDRSAPVVDINSPTTAAATSKQILAYDNDSGTTTWKYKVIEPTVPPTTLTCPATPPTDAMNYVENMPEAISAESANGGIVCFWSTDAAGNVGVGTSDSIAGIDRTSPTIVISAPSSVVKDGTATVTFTVTDESPPFDDDNFDAAGDITLTGTGGTIGAPSLKMGETHVFEATFTAGSTSGSAQDVTLQVPANKLEDAAGNGNDASNTVTISIVEVQPSETPAVALADASDTGAKDGRYTSQANPTFTVTFPGSSTYTATNSSVTVTATNEATNPDTVVTKIVTGATGSSVEVPFTSTTTGCDTSDDADTTADNPCTLAAGNTWKIQAAHTDTGASHSEALSAEIEVTVLAAAEAVTLTASSSTLPVASSTADDVVGETATLTFTVPASYAGPSDSALAVANIVTMTGSGGSLGGWSRSGNTYTATFTSSGLGTASFTVAASALMDLAGNNNPALATPATIAVQVGPRPLELRNLAAAGNSSDRDYDLKVTPKTSSSACANAGARDTEYTIAAGASVTVALGQDSGETTDCDWTFDFAAAGSDCAVSSWQFKESGHADDNAAQGHGDTTKASPTEVLEVSVSGGILWGTATIAKAVFDVVCPTNFDGALEVDVTDPFSTDLTGIDIRVTLEKSASQPAGCEVPGAAPSGVLGVDVALGAAAANPYPEPVAGLTDKLVDASSRMLAADADRCTYTAKFANEVNQNSASPPYRLVRTSAREVTLSNTDDNSRKATAEYRVLRTAVLSLTNPTTTGHGSATTRRDVSVSVTPGTGCGETAPSGSPFTVASGASDATAVEIDFGTVDCAWDLTFTNTADDCRVFAQPTEMFTGAMLSQANNSTGALTVHVINRRVRTASADDGGGSEVGSLKFTVPDPDDSMASPAGVCNTDLAGAMVEVEVDDRDSGTHTGTEFPVKVANGVRSDEGDSDEGTAPCSQNITDITLSLGAPTGAKSTATHTVTGLIGTLHDGATCSYEVTFPLPVTSVGSDRAAADSDDVPLVGQGSATATLQNSTKVSRTYQAVRSARLSLVNPTRTGQTAHAVDGMADVVVKLVAPDPANLGSGCVAAATGSPFTVKAGAAETSVVPGSTMTADLGTAQCEWKLTYNNPNSDCNVSVVLKDGSSPAQAISSSDFSYPAAGPSGELTLYVNASRLRTTNSASGTVVTAAEFTVSDTCTTYFNGTVALTVNDTMEATHTGGMIAVELEPPSGRSDCSAVTDDVMVNIGTRATTRSGGTPFTGVVNNLIDDPLGSGGPCTYTATFESPVTVGTGQAAVMFKRLEPTSGTATLSADNPATTNITESTVMAEYDAVRPALLALHNGTGPSDPAHVLDNMEQVGLSWVLNDSSSDCLSGLGSLMLAAGASAPSPVSLGTDDCQWDFNFANGPATGLLQNCQVEAQLQGLGPAYTDLPGVENTKTTTSTATPSTNNLGSFSVWVRGHRVMSQASGGAEVGRVEFEVSDNCTTFFDGTVSLTVSDTMEATHTGGMIAVALAPPAGRSDCSAVSDDVMVDIGTRATTRDGGTPFTGVAQNLIGTPLMAGSAACTYTATFTSPVTVGTGQAAVMFKRLEPTSDTAILSEDDTSTTELEATAAATYDAVRPALLALHNGTSSSDPAHVLPNMNRINMSLTLNDRTCSTATGPGVLVQLAAGTSWSNNPAMLGTENCQWDIGFYNGFVIGEQNCQVSAQLQGVGPGYADLPGAANTKTSTSTSDRITSHVGSFSLWVRDHRVFSDSSGGLEVGRVEFEVSDTCTTYFNRAVSVSTTNAPGVTGSHAGTTLDVMVSTGCARNRTETITLDAAGSGQATFMNLIDVPLGGTKCAYQAEFETGVASNNSLRLNRTSNSPVTFDADTAAAATAVAATYRAVSSAVFTLKNITQSNSLHPLATMRDVMVTVTPVPVSGCTASAPAGSPFVIGAASEQDVGLGTQQCVWNLKFHNRNSDCLVAAEFRAPDGTALPSVFNPATTAGTTVQINVDANRVIRMGGGVGLSTEVASLDFVVRQIDSCDTLFDAEVSLSVTDTANPTNPGVHAGTVFPVEVRQSGALAKCSADQTGNNALMLTLKADGTAEEEFKLVNRPYGASADCRYDVSFPASQNSAAAGATVTLVTADTTGVLNAGALSASATYDAVRPATLTLENVTSASLTPASRGTTQVTLTPSLCSGAGTAPTTITRTLGAAGSSGATMEANLGTQNCTWTVAFQNPQQDCAISARLTDSADADISSSRVTANNGAGSLIFYTQGRRARLANQADGTVLSKAKFAVSDTCSTIFNGTVSVQVSDRNTQASHTGTAFSVTVAPVSASGCSPSQNLTVTLSQALSGSTPVNNLVGTPLGQQACSYTVTYTDAVKVSAVDSTIQLERPSAFSATIREGNAQARTASLTYTAVRAATVELRNTTTASLTPLTRSTVQLTPASSSTCAASETARFDLTSAASSETVSLGTQACSWTIAFANPADDCVVSAQLKNTSGGNIGNAVTSKPSAGSVTLHVSSDRRVMSAASGGVEVASVEFAVTSACDTSFDATVSVSVSDTLAADESNRNHAGTSFDVRVAGGGAGCSASQSRQVTLSSANTATASFAGLRNTPAGGSACVYRVSFSSPVSSATNNRVQLVNTNTGSVTVSGLATSAALTYRAELIPEPVVIQAVSVSSAPPVTEGEPLLFPVSLPGPVAQAVQVSYTVSGGTTTTGTATIAAGQSSSVISVPTEDDQLDSANRTVRVTLTGVTGGVTIDQFGRTATGIVRDDDPSPTVGIKTASAIGDELRFTLELSARSARDVRVSYSTSLLARGTLVIAAGQLEASVQRLFDPVQLSRGTGLRLQLVSAQNATIDVDARERLLTAGVGGIAWRFHVTGRAGITPSEIAAAFGLPAGWRLHSWDTQFQRWVPHTATAGGRTALPRGTTITFRGYEPEEEQIAQAGLAPTSSVTLRQGWNIFTPAPDAIGLTSSDFTATAAGNSAVIFDPRLINCASLAGVLVIYTYDQTDPQAQNGFRIALPCHPQVQASAGIPAIETIDEGDTIYAWFNSTTPATLTYRNGRYSPA